MNATLTPLTHVSAGGFRWSLSAELRAVLLGPNGLRLDEWLRDGQARVVKQGPHRVVYRVDLPDLSFYLKHNLIPDRPSWLRQLVRPSKARNEYESALAVAERGIPTICPLGMGERQHVLGGGESFLLTRSLEDCIPLNSFLAITLPALAPARRTHIRQRLAEELGRLVGRIHDAGILHNDLHAANLLVRLTPDDDIALFVIDLNAVRVGPALDWRTSCKNLVMLNSWFVPRVNRTDRLRFWKAYYLARRLGPWQRGPNGPKPHAALAGEIEQQTLDFNLVFWRRRDRRCQRDNRYFRRVSGPGVAGIAVTELDARCLAPLLTDPDAPLRGPDVHLLKDSVTSTVAELTMIVDGVPRRVIYKRFHVASWSDPVTALMRPTPALRSWVHGQGFRERGLPTARPLAVLHRVRCGLRREGYLITEKIEHGQELHDFVQSLEGLPPAERQAVLRLQLERVARTIRELHERRLSHRDLKASNILVRRHDAPTRDAIPSTTNAFLNLLHMPEGSVWLIDLVGVENYPHLPRRRKVQNLGRLNTSFYHTKLITRTDRLRFLQIYLNWAIHGRGDWKTWWRQIEKATRAKIARNIRHGRPLG